MKLRGQGAGLLAAVWLTLACGSQRDGDIPPELLTAISEGSKSQAKYPEGNTGGEVGQIADNRCIRAWRNPAADEFDAADLTPLCLGDFWDESGQDHQLLLLNTSAIWCQVCAVEYQGNGVRGALREEAKQRESHGLRVLGSLFQDAQFNPATEANAVAWARTFKVDFPFGLDASFEFGAFASADVQPLNMVIDTQSMIILLKTQEADAAWQFIDARLGL